MRSTRQPARARFYRQSCLLMASFILASVGISTTTVLLWKKSQAKAVMAQTEPVTHPTAIPWLTSQSACEATGRHWHNETCWDGEHSPKF